MGRIERGEVNLTIEKVYELAKALEIPVIDLLPKEVVGLIRLTLSYALASSSSLS